MTTINGPPPENDGPARMDTEAALKQRIGQQIRDIRKLRRLSMQHLADEIGVSSHQIYKYENGTDHISVSLLYRVSIALRVPINDFYYGTGEAQNTILCRNETHNMECPDVHTIFEAFERIKSPEMRARIGRLILALKG